VRALLLVALLFATSMAALPQARALDCLDYGTGVCFCTESNVCAYVSPRDEDGNACVNVGAPGGGLASCETKLELGP